MRTFKSSALLVVAAVAALVGSSLPVLGSPSTGVQAGAPAAVTTSASAGTLRLSTTSSAGVIDWNGEQQRFSGGQQCSLVPTPGGSALLELRGYVGAEQEAAGFRNGDIGVFEPQADGSPANAAQCARVDAGSFTADETLGLRLGADVADEFGAIVATRATVDIVRNSQAGFIRVTLVAADGTETSLPSISWRGGRSGSDIPTPAFTGVFTELRLTADEGSFSLRGAELTLASAADATFCVDGAVGATYTNDTGVTVRHLGNADGSACTAFGIRLTGTDTARVWFIKPLDVDREAQFIFEVPWNTVGWPALTPGSDLPQAFIDFENTDPPTEIEMPYCPDYLYDATGTLVGLDGSNAADRAALAALDMVTDVPGDLRTEGTQFACIGDRDASVTKAAGEAGFEVDVTDLIYLIGDAKMSLK
jgi:hypothetical protein